MSGTLTHDDVIYLRGQISAYDHVLKKCVEFNNLGELAPYVADVARRYEQALQKEAEE